MRRQYDDEAKEYRVSLAAFEAEKRSIERDNKLTHPERRQRLRDLREPVAPLLPVIRAKEPNLEGLLNVLRQGRASIGIFTSEGGQFLGGHGMGQEAKTRTVTGLSELWDSGSAQRIRAQETLFLTGRRVGISLAAQPQVASALLGDELAKDQGFVGRFLVTMPDSTIGARIIRETQLVLKVVVGPAAGNSIETVALFVATDERRIDADATANAILRALEVVEGDLGSQKSPTEPV